MKTSRYIDELASDLFESWEVEESLDTSTSLSARDETEVDLTDYRHVSVDKKDDFEAIDISELDFMK